MNTAVFDRLEQLRPKPKLMDFHYDIINEDNVEEAEPSGHTSPWDVQAHRYVSHTSSLRNSYRYVKAPMYVFDNTATFSNIRGLMINPLCRVKEDEPELKVIDKRGKDIQRCKQCKAFLSPFSITNRYNSHWNCHLCGILNRIEEDYFLEADGSFDELGRKIELNSEVFEYIAPDNYHGAKDFCHPNKYIIVIDINLESLKRTIMDNIN